MVRKQEYLIYWSVHQIIRIPKIKHHGNLLMLHFYNIECPKLVFPNTKAQSVSGNTKTSMDAISHPSPTL